MPCRFSCFCWLVGCGGLNRLCARSLSCLLPPETAVLRGRRAGRALRGRCRDLGFRESRILAFGFSARGVAARPDSREKPPRDPGSGAAAPEIPRRDSRNPRIPESGTRPPPAVGPMLWFCSVACVKKGARLGRCLPLGSLESPA